MGEIQMISKELAQLFIQNMELMESANEIINKIEKKLFAAINQKIQDRIDEKGNWEGSYTFMPNYDAKNGYEGDTEFKPINWKKEEDEFKSCYVLGSIVNLAGEDCEYWLSSATNTKGTALCLYFWLNQSYYGKTKPQKSVIFKTLYENNSILSEYGFIYDKQRDEDICLPIHFDVPKLVEEYPDFDESLKPLDKALDALFAVHDIFDQFVKKLEEEIPKSK